MKNTVKEVMKAYWATIIFIVAFVVGVIGMAFGNGTVLMAAFVTMLASVQFSLQQLDAMDE